MSILGNISVDDFLQNYWQKKPLLIRGAFADRQAILNLISPEELAGYSLDEEIESRLVSHDDSSTNWQLEQGPLEEETFAALDDKNWTLLVQSLDFFHSSLQQLIEACDFIPRWRLDDVMVSYATDGGGVGAHLDKYDVFLIQGEGKRRWRVGYKSQAVVKAQHSSELAQIEPFTEKLDVIIETGDLLYIPPNTPHWGVSIDESICFSVGFRAPSVDNLMQQLLETNQTALQSLWKDQDLLTVSMATGELPSAMGQWLQKQTNSLFNQRDLMIATGKEVTQLKYPEVLEEISFCEAQEVAELAFKRSFRIHPLARIAHFCDDLDLLTFINGDYFQYPLVLKGLLNDLNLRKTITPQVLAQYPTSPTLDFISNALALSALEFVE